METISEFERDFLQNDALENYIVAHTVRIQEFLKDPETAQRIILEYLQQVAQLTVDLNFAISENQQVCCPASVQSTGLGGNAAHRTSIIKRLSGSHLNTPFKVGRNILQRQQALATVQTNVQLASTPRAASLHRRGSDSNIKLRKTKQSIKRLANKSPLSVDRASPSRSATRPLSFQSDGCEESRPAEQSRPDAANKASTHSPAARDDASRCVAPSTSFAALKSSFDSTSKHERRLSISAMDCCELHPSDHIKTQKSSSITPSCDKYHAVSACSKRGDAEPHHSPSGAASVAIATAAASGGASTTESHSKSRGFGSMFGGLFSAKRRSRSSHITLDNEASSTPSRKRIPKFLRNLGARRLSRHGGSNSSLRKHEAIAAAAASSARRSAPESSNNKSSITGVKQSSVRGVSGTKSKSISGASTVTEDRNRNREEQQKMRYVDASSYRVSNETSHELSVSPLNAVPSANAVKFTSVNEFMRARSGSMVNSAIAKKIQVHLAQIATLQIPTVFELEVDQCSVVTATIPPVTHHVASISDKCGRRELTVPVPASSRSATASTSSSTSASRCSRSGASRAAASANEHEIAEWLSRTRQRLEKLLNELGNSLETKNDKHYFAPFSAATLARILAGASDEERLRQLRTEYERHLMLDRQLKFALMRQHHTILFVIAMLLGRKLDANQLSVSYLRASASFGKKRKGRRPLRRAFTFSSRAMSTAMYNGMLCAGLLEQTTELLLADAQRFSEDVARDLIKSLDESNERTQVLLTTKKSLTMPTSRLGIGNAYRPIKASNRPHSTEMLNRGGTSPSSSFVEDLAREHRRTLRRNSGETQFDLNKDEKLRAALQVLLKH